ncbi:Glycosyl transferase family 2 [Nitrosospira multiformis]|uniref:Glycosyl transferase family 2 n=2 Tax=Nitrosospira multiformis TaxID=1231 RepID=A0A1H8P1A9_9PROT|nr:Glycosyl transferase family 2 [Nitrosospira multiformis]
MKNYIGLQFIARWKLLWATPLLGTEGQAGDPPRNKTTLVTMIRNEKTILETFCAHVLSLFDRIILVDHLSSDGSREYIKLLSEKYPNIECYFFDEPGYYQSELMTWVAKNLVDQKMSGWVFFLDADEFLPFKSKEEFDHKLSGLDSFPVISMPWLNLVPLDMESGEVVNRVFLKPPKASRHPKIAFQPNRIFPTDYFIAQGNHALFLGTRSSKVKFPARDSFPIYHLPIRTKQQLRDKILYGVESYQRMGRDRRGKNGSHWDEIHRIMEATSLTNELMAGIASQYSDTLNPPYEKSFDELREAGYRELQMEISFLHPLASFADIASEQEEKITVEGTDSLREIRTQTLKRRIDFDRSTHSMQMIEGTAPRDLQLPTLVSPTPQP